VYPHKRVFWRRRQQDFLHVRDAGGIGSRELDGWRTGQDDPQSRFATTFLDIP